MDLNDAAVFVKVVEAGSFSGAARLLGVPTSTVSSRVARLEQQLGVTLMQRTTRRLHLTGAGQLYFTRASEGLAHLQEAEAAVTAEASVPAGLLRVTAPADIGEAIFTAILCRMRKQWPQVDIELVLVDRYVDLVAEGIDVAIRTGQLKDSSLMARKVGVANWVLYASEDYLTRYAAPESPQALRQHCCLQFTPLGKDAWTLNSADTSVTVPMSRQVMANDIGVISAMAAAGEGVALLPTFLCRQDSVAGRLVQVLPDWHAKLDPIHIVYPRQRFVPPRLRAFLDLAAEELARWLG